MRNDSADARALMAAQRYDEAIPLLQQAITHHPQDPVPRCLLAICLLNVGKAQGAADMAGSAIALDPNAEWPHRIRSQALAAVGKHRQALQDAEQAARANPQEANALFALGERLIRRRWRLKRAAEIARRGLALDPTSLVGHDLLARIELRRGRWKEAESAYRNLLTMRPDSWVLMNNLGIALKRQGRNKEAIQMFENAARANPRAKLAQRNLYLTTRNYVGVGLFAIILAINGVRILAGYFRTDPFGAAAVALILVSVVLALVVIKARRKTGLSPIARSFYREERRRELIQTGPFVAGFLIGAFAIIFLSLMLFRPLQYWSLVLMVGGVPAWWFGWRYLWVSAIRSWVEARL